MSDEHIHPPPSNFITKYIFSVDHKVIAKQYLFTGIAWLFVGDFAHAVADAETEWNFRQNLVGIRSYLSL